MAPVNRRTSCLGSGASDLRWALILLLEAPCAMESPGSAIPLHPREHTSCWLLPWTPVCKRDSNKLQFAHLVVARGRQVRMGRERREVRETVLLTKSCCWRGTFAYAGSGLVFQCLTDPYLASPAGGGCPQQLCPRARPDPVTSVPSAQERKLMGTTWVQFIPLPGACGQGESHRIHVR